MNETEQCEHQHTTNMLLCGTFNKTWSSERRYEVYFCTDCNRLVDFNGTSSGDCAMSAKEVELMFGDLRGMINDIAEMMTEPKQCADKMASMILGK